MLAAISVEDFKQTWAFTLGMIFYGLVKVREISDLL